VLRRAAAVPSSGSSRAGGGAGGWRASRARCVSKTFCRRALFVSLYPSLLLIDVQATTVEAHSRHPAIECGSPSVFVCVYVIQQQTTAAKRLRTRMTAPHSSREAWGAKAAARPWSTKHGARRGCRPIKDQCAEIQSTANVLCRQPMTGTCLLDQTPF